jgi:hypothetical protein
MPWWSRMYHIKNLTLDPKYDENFASLGRIIDFCDQRFKETDLKDRAKKVLTTDFETSFTSSDKQKYFFIHKFFERYPNMRSVYISHDLSEMKLKNSQSMSALSFLMKEYVKRINKGLSKETATEEVLARVEYRLQLLIDEQKTTLDLANSNKAISFLDFSLSEKIRESELKTKRIRRDTDFQALIDGSLLEEFDAYEPNYKVVSENYNRSSEDINPDDFNEILSERAIEKEQNELQDFVTRSKNLMNKYYEDVVTRDRLNGMADKEVLMRVANSPTSLQKHFAPLIKICEKNGISLNYNGEVNYNKANSPTIVKKLKSKEELVKYALMLKDMNYGFKHKEELRKRAQKLSNELREHNQQASIELQETKQQNIKAILEKLKLPQSEVEGILDFIYFEKQHREEDFAGEPVLDKFLTEQKLIRGEHGRIDWQNELRDSIYERNLKLEAQWLKDRALNLSLSPENHENIVMKLVDTVTKLRRVKLLFDKQAYTKAAQIFFEEHSDVNFDLETVEIEKLEDYFKISSEVFSRNPEEENEFQKSKNAVKKRILRRNLNDSFKRVSPLQSKPDLPLNYEEAADQFWQLKKDEVGEQFAGKSISEGQPVNLNYLKILEATPEEIKNYKKNNPYIAEPEKDPFMRYLEQKNRSRNKVEVEKKKKGKGK